jgi:hypothetical protein
MKRSKIFLFTALLVGMGGAIFSRANESKHTLFYFNAGAGCSSTTTAPPCPGAKTRVCTIAGVTYFGTDATCGTALQYTP